MVTFVPPSGNEKSLGPWTKLAKVLKAKIREVDTLLEQMKSQAKNKKSESYPVVLSDPLEIREEGKRNTTDNKAIKSRKRY